MKIRCIAIDDEPLALDILSAYCARVPFLELLRTFDNAMETLEYLRTHPVDLLFLDIEMEGLTGIQLLNVLKERPHVILTSAYDRYAMQGYDLDVDDYLLKPISLERFLRGVNKVRERMGREASGSEAVPPSIPPPAEGEPDYFFVKTETRIEEVLASEVLYVEGMGDYWKIVTPKKRIMTLMNARGIDEMLREPRFCRVHKSWYVALDKIHFVERRHIKIGNERIPVSETYQKHFFDLIENNKMAQHR